ncbi:MAG: EF-P lysine aminoacylase EpmA [Alphaproteobacteria bacterium]
MSDKNKTWWAPERLDKDAAILALRSKARAQISKFFDAQHFVEVETPALQISPGMEPHIAAFATRLMPPGAAFADTQPTNINIEGVKPETGQQFYLHTSPEFAMKKLLAGGLEQIWQFTKCYRNGEATSLHHPEFTMIEWYRATAQQDKKYRATAQQDHKYQQEQLAAEQATLEDIKLDLLALIRRVSGLSKDHLLHYKGKTSDPFKDWQVLSVAQAFDEYAQLDLEALIGSNVENPCVEAIAIAAQKLEINVSADDQFEDVFFKIMGMVIEPKLGSPVPTLLTHYPISMAALARPYENDARWAERFELFINGVELANGFGELTDPDEQRRRFVKDQQLKQKLYGVYYPIDEDFIESLEHIQAAAGIALGFDRLVMLLGDADHIHQALWAWVD